MKKYTIVNLFLLVISLFIIIFIVRVTLVFGHRGRALKCVYHQEYNWKKRRCNYVKYSYGGQVLSFNKWTYKQMFPELYKLELEQ